MLKKKTIEEIIKNYRKILSQNISSYDVIHFFAKIEALEMVLEKKKPKGFQYNTVDKKGKRNDKSRKVRN